jgi:hypothetical protein
MLYYKDGYKRVYIPNIESVKLSDLEHYRYIKTIDVGRQKGHIIEGNNEYIMCLSKDDTVRVHLDIYLPLGFTRKTIEELESLGHKFYKAYKTQFSRTYNGENRVLRKNLKKVVEPAKFDSTKNWPDKAYGHYVINVKTKKEVSLCKPKLQIAAEIGMSTVLLDTMLSCGYLIYDWCYKGKLLDGRTWDEYFSGVVPKKKIYETVEVIKFVKDNDEVIYTNMRTTACKLKTNDRVLSKAIKTQTEINGYKILRERVTVERDGL